MKMLFELIKNEPLVHSVVYKDANYARALIREKQWLGHPCSYLLPSKNSVKDNKIGTNPQENKTGKSSVCV